MYASRVQGRQILLENPARESRAKKELKAKRLRQKAEKEKKRKGIISKREAKERGVWRLDETQAKFDLFVPLHHLWMGYMSELLGLSQQSSSAFPTTQMMPPSAGMHPKLVKADYHGSIMTVRQSKNPCLVGLSGIVIHETENAFRIITPKDQVKLVPKENSIFAFAVPLYSTLPASYRPTEPLPIPDLDNTKATVLQVPHMEFELYGNQFRFRAADRAGRKFKHKETAEL
ncbi:RNase P subunit p29-like protein [Tricholoma matsutake]|nr:RNase P subunit p29-like protein [Tricholoma matsutake 945]